MKNIFQKNGKKIPKQKGIIYNNILSGTKQHKHTLFRTKHI